MVLQIHKKYLENLMNKFWEKRVMFERTGVDKHDRVANVQVTGKSKKALIEDLIL